MICFVYLYFFSIIEERDLWLFKKRADFIFVFGSVRLKNLLAVTKKQSKQGMLYGLCIKCINCATKILVDQRSTDRIKSV